MPPLGTSHHHEWNTPKQALAWLDELAGYHHSERRYNLLESYRERLQTHGALSELQARTLKDIWEEVVCGC